MLSNKMYLNWNTKTGVSDQTSKTNEANECNDAIPSHISQFTEYTTIGHPPTTTTIKI